VDLKNPQDVNKAIEGAFHYATNPEIHFSENVMATFNLLEAARRADIGELVFAFSSSVYSEAEIIPVNEEIPVRPVSIYGASKAACENLIHAYSKLYGIKAVVLRYANVVGPRLRHGVVHDFIVKLKKNPEELEILGDGAQIRSYIYVDDAIEATMVAYNNSRKHFDTYNVASEDWITVNEVAEAVTSVMGLRDVIYAYKPVLHGIGWLGDVKRIALDVRKLKELGWRPSEG